MSKEQTLALREIVSESRFRVRAASVIGEPWPARSWPGCYSIEYVTDDGELLCADCMSDPTNPVHFAGDRDGWRIVGVESAANGDHETESRCAHCNALIVEADES